MWLSVYCRPPNYVPLSIGLLFIAPFCGVPCLVFALRAQRAHARGLEKVSRKNNDYAFMLLIMALMFLALVLLIYLVWQMTSALCLPLPSTAAPVTPRGTSKYRQYARQSKNGIDRLNHSQSTMMPRFRSHDTMLDRPVKLNHDNSDRPPSVPWITVSTLVEYVHSGYLLAYDPRLWIRVTKNNFHTVE